MTTDTMLKPATLWGVELPRNLPEIAKIEDKKKARTSMEYQNWVKTVRTPFIEGALIISDEMGVGRTEAFEKIATAFNSAGHPVTANTLQTHYSALQRAKAVASGAAVVRRRVKTEIGIPAEYLGELNDLIARIVKSQVAQNEQEMEELREDAARFRSLSKTLKGLVGE